MLRDMVDAVLAAAPRLGEVRVLAIDGPSGSGKTTLARRVRDKLRARAIPTVLTSTDDFATWDDPVAWWPRLAAGVLRPLAAGTEGGYRAMDWTAAAPRLDAWVRVPVPWVLVWKACPRVGVDASRVVSAVLGARTGCGRPVGTRRPPRGREVPYPASGLAGVRTGLVRHRSCLAARRHDHVT